MVPSLADWLVSPRSGVAYLDLRQGSVRLEDADSLVDSLLPYFERKQVSDIVVAVKGPGDSRRAGPSGCPQAGGQHSRSRRRVAAGVAGLDGLDTRVRSRG